MYQPKPKRSLSSTSGKKNHAWCIKKQSWKVELFGQGRKGGFV
jgi:hypothetical protein